MRKKKPSLLVRAELYGHKHAPYGAVKAGYTDEKALMSRAWRAGYLQARRDARGQKS